MTTREQSMRLLTTAQEILRDITEQARTSAKATPLVQFDYQHDPQASIPRRVRLLVVVDITDADG